MLSRLVTPCVLDWLRDGRSAHVLHQFKEVINLVNDQGELISIATPAVGPGPFTLIVEGDFRSHFIVGRPIQIDNQRLCLKSGQLTIDARQAAIWQPRPAWSKLRELSFADLPPARLLPDEIDGYLLQLLQGIVQGDKGLCRAAAYGLAGRGQGLTPTGDDVLMGVLYGLWVWFPRREMMTVIVETAVPRTTTLSAAFLKAAAAGEATIHWHHLVNGRADAINRLLAIGHTSGADAWAGFNHTRIALTGK